MSDLAHHPADEELAQFVDGTLDGERRRAIVEHIADCDECRIVAADSASFVDEESAADRAPHTSRFGWRAIAAAMIVAIAGTAFWYTHRDPLAPLVGAYARLQTRPIEGQLSGFPFVPVRISRGGASTDPAALALEGVAADVASRSGSSPMDLHARGVAHLLGGDANTARRELKSAAEAEPRNATYWNDVAAADLAANDATAGLAAAETAMRRDPSLPQAQFNRAVALAALGRNAEAQSAFDSIVAHNPNSELAAEAARRRSRIPFHESTAK